MISEDNGGHKSLGWGRMVTKFLMHEANIKLFRDSSFYGKISNENYVDGFIFDEQNCSLDLLPYISDEFFEIRRGTVKNGINLKPAVLKVLGRTGLFINETFVKPNGRKLLKSGDRIKVCLQPPYRYTLFEFHDDRDFLTRDFPDEIVHDYHIGFWIGKGGQSSVRLIHEYFTEEKYAMKILSKERRHEENDFKYNKRVQHMRGEVEAMRQLDHPNIIKLVTVTETEKDVFIIMEFAESGSLLDHMQRHSESFLPEKEGRDCLFQVCKAVEYIHSKNIAHRDLKVENIFVKSCQYGNIMKVGDFGYAKSADQLNTQVGTPCFLPPEILHQRGEYTIKSDIWTLGCLFFSVLSGSFPFHSDYGDSVRRQIMTAHISFCNHQQWNFVS